MECQGGKGVKPRNFSIHDDDGFAWAVPGGLFHLFPKNLVLYLEAWSQEFPPLAENLETGVDATLTAVAASGVDDDDHEYLTPRAVEAVKAGTAGLGDGLGILAGGDAPSQEWVLEGPPAGPVLGHDVYIGVG